jgi:hypothetical protein
MSFSHNISLQMIDDQELEEENTSDIFRWPDLGRLLAADILTV